MAKSDKTEEPTAPPEESQQGADQGSPSPNSPDPNPTATSDELPGEQDVGQGEIQAKVDIEEEQGFRGIKVDPTPNENYTVDGVTSGAPTPENDQSARAEAKAGLKVEGPEPLP